MSEQPYDVHDKWHASVGGDVEGVGGANDPLFWFHHAALVKVMSVWQQRNSDLRPTAWGYFASSAFRADERTSNAAPADLNDVLGAHPTFDPERVLARLDATYDPQRDVTTPALTPMLGMGFDRDRMLGKADRGMDAPPAVTRAAVLPARPAQHSPCACGGPRHGRQAAHQSDPSWPQARGAPDFPSTQPASPPCKLRPPSSQMPSALAPQATTATPMTHSEMLCGEVEALYTYDATAPGWKNSGPGMARNAASMRGRTGSSGLVCGDH